MKKITTIDKPTLVALRASINAALASVASDYGISISAGNATFSANNAVFKLNVALIGQGGAVLDAGAERFKRYAHQVGLKPEDLGTTFSSQGKLYKIDGIRPAIFGKCPIFATCVSDGCKFCFPTSTVKASKLLDQAANQPAVA
jgi:hypothetical protein